MCITYDAFPGDYFCVDIETSFINNPRINLFQVDKIHQGITEDNSLNLRE